MHPRLRCALFDIDGTLVSMRGAGPRAMDAAFERLTGIPQAFQGVSMAGRSDRAITESAIRRLFEAGREVPRDEAFHRRFTEAYLAELAHEVWKPGPTACPGVLCTLDLLERRGVMLALGTGNYAGAARIKLERFGLWSRFVFGGFGDDTCERVEVIRRAAAEARRRCGCGPEGLLVIGDTPGDIAAARAVGAPVLSVATGPYAAEELEGHRPDRLVPTLLDALAAGLWT
ncbi:MAG: HAD family hydrolase [Deltaproteobacteria bacterium]|nr:HAD family hydrolase [Deltaproteobacteria bacterium]